MVKSIGNLFSIEVTQYDNGVNIQELHMTNCKVILQDLPTVFLGVVH